MGVGWQEQKAPQEGDFTKDFKPTVKGPDDPRHSGESFVKPELKGKNRLLKLGAAGIALAALGAYLTTLFAHDSNPQPIQPTPEPQKAGDMAPKNINSMEDLEYSQNVEGPAQREKAAAVKVEATAQAIQTEVANEPKFYGPPSSAKK